jgi:hypothetical protein
MRKNIFIQTILIMTQKQMFFLTENNNAFAQNSYTITIIKIDK